MNATTSTPFVILGCELYGYVEPAEIVWSYGNTLLYNDTNQTIIAVNGNHTIQHGSIAPIPSVKSLLTIHYPSVANSGVYQCTAGHYKATIHLRVTDNDDNSTHNATDVDWTAAGMDSHYSV